MLQQIAELLGAIRSLLAGIRYASTVEITCAAAVDYAAGDVLSATATDGAGVATYVPNLAARAGGVATLMSIVASCSEDAVLASLRLHFFRNPPVPADVEMDDNIPFDIKTENGRSLWAGSVLLNALADRGTAASTSDTDDIRKPIRCAEGATGLWMVVTAEVAEANESVSMKLKFEFYTL